MKRDTPMVAPFPCSFFVIAHNFKVIKFFSASNNVFVRFKSHWKITAKKKSRKEISAKLCTDFMKIMQKNCEMLFGLFLQKRKGAGTDPLNCLEDGTE